jgi:hypothetical protein
MNCFVLAEKFPCFDIFPFEAIVLYHLQSGYDPLAIILNPTYLLHANGQGGIMNI